MSRYPDYLSPNPTPTKQSKAQKSRARREPSGVFSLFQAPQIQQFKEAFQLIDHDKDVEGMQVIADLHGGDPEDLVARAEFQEIKERVLFDVSSQLLRPPP